MERLIKLFFKAIAAAVMFVFAFFGFKTLNASEKKNQIIKQNKENIEKLKNKIDEANGILAELGSYEAGVIEDFKLFAELMNGIKNVEPPSYDKEGIEIPDCNINEIKAMSFEILAFKDGVAAIGIAAFVGAAVNGVATVIQKIIKDDTPEAKVIGNVAATGTGILAGAVYLVKASVELSEDVEEAQKEMIKNQEKINAYILSLSNVEDIVIAYINELKRVHGFYLKQIEVVRAIIAKSGNDYKKYKKHEELSLQNLWLLTELLFRFCNTPIFLKEENNGYRVVNSGEINDVVSDSKIVVSSMRDLKSA